jgi:hypothetical protein
VGGAAAAAHAGPNGGPGGRASWGCWVFGARVAALRPRALGRHCTCRCGRPRSPAQPLAIGGGVTSPPRVCPQRTGLLPPLHDALHRGRRPLCAVRQVPVRLLLAVLQLVAPRVAVPGRGGAADDHEPAAGPRRVGGAQHRGRDGPGGFFRLREVHLVHMRASSSGLFLQFAGWTFKAHEQLVSSPEPANRMRIPPPIPSRPPHSPPPRSSSWRPSSCCARPPARAPAAAPPPTAWRGATR